MPPSGSRSYWARGAPNSGLHATRPRAWRQMTDVDVTWSSTASRIGEGHCAATPRWCPPCCGICRRTVQQMKTGPQLAAASAASSPRIPSCSGAVPSALWFSAQKWGDAAVRRRARNGAVGSWAGPGRQPLAQQRAIRPWSLCWTSRMERGPSPFISGLECAGLALAGDLDFCRPTQKVVRAKKLNITLA